MGAPNYIKHYKVFQSLNGKIIAKDITLEEAVELLDTTHTEIEKAIIYGNSIKGYSVEEVTHNYDKNVSGTKLLHLIKNSN